MKEMICAAAFWFSVTLLILLGEGWVLDNYEREVFEFFRSLGTLFTSHRPAIALALVAVAALSLRSFFKSQH